MSPGGLWERIGTGKYRHLPSGAVVERYQPQPAVVFPTVWVVRGESGHWPTLREAQGWVEEQWRLVQPGAQ